MSALDDLRNLDINDIGRWPLLFRLLFIALIFTLVVVGGVYYMVVKSRLPILDSAEAKEIELRREFENKQGKAVNLDAYRLQLAEMQDSFGNMLRQLPGKTEVPSLLVDISQTGLASGLEEKLFQPRGEIKKDFYAELPIAIRLTGDYHELAEFVSGIAALPRIVTLHDITVKRASDNKSELTMDVTAKTYRYLEDEEEEGN